MAHRPAGIGSALAWNYLGALARIAAQLAVGLALARLVGPEPYGQVAAAMVPVSLAGLVGNGGLTAAAVQRRNLDPRDLAGAWWLQVGISSGLALGLALAAPVLARALGQPGAAPVLRALAPLLPVNAAAGLATAVLLRDLRSRPVAASALVSYLAGCGGVGLGLAWAGAGVWAVVASQLVQALLHATVVHALARPALGRPRWPAALTRFGAWALVTNLCFWVLGNLHQVLISRSLGGLALGFYSRFALFTETATLTITAPLQQILVPAVARAPHPARRRAIVAAAVVGTGWVFLPAMGFLALHARAATEVLLGPAYLVRADLLPPLAVAGALLALAYVGAPSLAGSGRPRADWAVQAAGILASLPVLLATLPRGLAALGWGLALVAGVRLAVAALLLWRAGLAPVRDQATALGRAAAPAAVSLAASLLFARWPGTRAAGPHLALAALGAILGWAGTLGLGWRVLAPPPFRRQAARILGGHR